MMFWWGKGGDGGRELLLNTLFHNSSYFIFKANEGMKRWRKEAEQWGNETSTLKGL